MMLTLLLPLLFAWFVSPSEPMTLPENIFILAGQSNMAGRGGVVYRIWDGIVPPESRPSPLILRLGAELAWEEAQEPLHADIDVNRTCGVGPGLAFANAVLEKEPSLGAIGLVPCAVGGTRIREWARGTRLYDELVRRAEAAGGYGGVVRAVLWFQGETDAASEEDAVLYKGRLERFILDLRSDLKHPTLPIFQVALASGQGPFVDMVREAQLQIDLENVTIIDAMGLPLEPDGLHLTTEAEVRVGEMFADAFLQTISRSYLNPATETVSYLLYRFWMNVIFASTVVILAIYRSLFKTIL